MTDVARTEDSKHEVDQVAYDTKDTPYRTFHIRASYLKAPSDGKAFIEIFRRGSPWSSQYYPAYRIYNLVAHFSDMVDAELENAELAACQT